MTSRSWPRMLRELGFGPQPGPDPWPASTGRCSSAPWFAARPTLPPALHVQPGTEELRRDIAFRDALRADPALTGRTRTSSPASSRAGSARATSTRTRSRPGSPTSIAASGSSAPPIAPPATIGILGGGQLGRMLALAARAMGYRIVGHGPGPGAARRPRSRTGGSSPAYDDVGGALRLAASLSDVVTYELEHVAAEVVDAIDAIVPVRPGRVPAAWSPRTGSPSAGSSRRAGAEVAAVARGPDDGRAARGGAKPWACRSGSRPRPAATTGGASSAWSTAADARGRDRAARPTDRNGPAGRARARRSRWSCRSSSRAASTAGPRAFPVARNVHDGGILVESVAPAPVADRGRGPCRRPRGAAGGRDGPDRHADRRAVPHARRPPRRQRARPAGPQQRPLDDRRGGDLPVRAAHPGDLRPRPRLDRGPRARRRWSTCWAGAARGRPGSTRSGLARAMADPAAHLHVYDKRRGVRTPQDGPRDRDRGDRSTRRWTGRARPHGTCAGSPRTAIRKGTAAGHDAQDRASRELGRRTGHLGSASSAAAARTSRSSSRPCAVLDDLGVATELRVVSAHRTPDHAVPLRGGRPPGAGSG